MLIKPGPLCVLMVSARCLPYIGGIETHIYEVGRRLVRSGVEVTVLSTDVSGQLPVTEEMEGMQIHRAPAWPTNKDYYFAPDIYRFIMSGQWDLIHCQGYHNLVAPVAIFAARAANIPYILTFHSGGDTSLLRKMLRRLHWKMLRPLLAHSQKLIAVSEFEATFFRERLQLPAKQFVVIPNGANLPQKVPCKASDIPLILSVGRLEQYKGHQRLITALPKLCEWYPDTQLLIVGRGPYESTLRKLAHNLGVANHVEFRAVPADDRRAMAELLGRATCVALLSEYEAHPIAVVEALALQRPVLVTATSGLKELAEQGLVRAVPLKCTPEEVARALQQQIEEPITPPTHLTLSSWDECSAKLLTLYNTVIQRQLCVS